MWLAARERYRAGVLFLLSNDLEVNPYRPYRETGDDRTTGTGLLVDAERGLVVTNAHVVAKSAALLARSPALEGWNMPLEVVALCRERDLALCRLEKRGAEALAPLASAPLFGDNLLLRETEKVMAIGYPYGETGIQYTTGVISGFGAGGRGENDPLGEEESPSYIQITAPINPGNSGGPLVNKKGEVVGINAAGHLYSNGVGYAIGSRTFLSLYRRMVSPPSPLLPVPRYGFELCPASSDLLSRLSGGSLLSGAYVSAVSPLSCFPRLRVGDVLLALSFSLPRVDGLSLPFFLEEGDEIRSEVSRTGSLSFSSCSPEEELAGRCAGRRLRIKDLFDMMPLGNRVTLEIVRAGRSLSLTAEFLPREGYERSPGYPLLSPYPYLLLAGLCLGELSFEHVGRRHPRLLPFLFEKRREPALVVNQVFPGTVAEQVSALGEGSILAAVNGRAVRTIGDLLGALEGEEECVDFLATSGCRFVLSLSRAGRDDLRVAEEFGIPPERCPLLGGEV